jgi:hypothetical protein
VVGWGGGTNIDYFTLAECTQNSPQNTSLYLLLLT